MRPSRRNASEGSPPTPHRRAGHGRPGAGRVRSCTAAYQQYVPCPHEADRQARSSRSTACRSGPTSTPRPRPSWPTARSARGTREARSRQQGVPADRPRHESCSPWPTASAAAASAGGPPSPVARSTTPWWSFRPSCGSSRPALSLAPALALVVWRSGSWRWFSPSLAPSTTSEVFGTWVRHLLIFPAFLAVLPWPDALISGQRVRCRGDGGWSACSAWKAAEAGTSTPGSRPSVSATLGLLLVAA